MAEFKGWTIEALSAEIKREEAELATLRTDLAANEARRTAFVEALGKERLPTREARLVTRAALIAALEAFIPEEERQIRRYEERIRERQAEVDRYEARIRVLEARLSSLAPVQRYVQREVIRGLIRTIIALRGWQRRDTARIRTVRNELRSNRLRLATYREWQVREVPEVRRLRELRDAIREVEAAISSLQAEIAAEEERLKQKYAALPKLYRVKIRLYAVKKRRNYYLTFQGFFDVDAILNPETGLPVWEWWLTKQEIDYAKYHFHGYWKGGVKSPKPFDTADIEQAYFDDTGGISTPKRLEEKPEIRYAKDVPSEFTRLAENMTLREIIVGMSSIKPRPITEPEGVFSEYFMIIDQEGDIKWIERRDKWVWKPTQEIIDRVKKELGI